MNEGKSKLTLVPLILMIFTAVFGFANMPRAFYLMGYAAIPWYVISAILFFIPYALMLSEFGAAFKDEKGGIYSWMEKSVGPKFAFVGTFMWYASYVTWMVNICSSIWIPLSNAIFGTDKTSTWHLFGLTSTQFLGVLGVCWITFITIVASKGLEKIKKVTSVAGTAVSLLNLVLLFAGLLILVLNKGQLAQPITGVGSFVDSPNQSYHSLISLVSFMVFAIFAYGGIEVVGGLVDETENPEKTFPKAVTIAAIIISLGYCIGIFVCGFFVNWNSVLSSNTVHMGNVAYVVMKNLGYQLGMALGTSQSVAISMGAWVARYTGLSMFLALTGAFFSLAYSPLKQLIEGTPKEMWPGKMGEITEGIPKNALKIQGIIVAVMVLLVSFGGDAAKEFFGKLVLMTNVAMTIPYMFIAIAFPFFKKKTEIKKPVEIYKSYTVSVIVTVIVVAVVGLANVFTIIEPATNGKIMDTVWMLAGPVVFSIVAIIIYYIYERKNRNKFKK
ncbi:glutamate/gamma-aminobutyrate family transporter YjeM [Inconstantimicrobium mannanitabidum]|uniref:Glutamate/gamma-aminobutyrate family transporter YjeM n=1 Tax=Inconstantimicrobium mannanitabidum TaxID=1604901 RepID=A0ACB5RHP8_9CLOT|nr:glutamate/gamma-aminobutyrate family transporter YjeM [Clostridium sp. TW13]GKX68601.1 glutamate/gamma-aminobutyrate family transporter YjeM [Clostridium sp. TW13]